MEKFMLENYDADLIFNRDWKVFLQKLEDEIYNEKKP